MYAVNYICIVSQICVLAAMDIVGTFADNKEKVGTLPTCTRDHQTHFLIVFS